MEGGEDSEEIPIEDQTALVQDDTAAGAESFEATLGGGAEEAPPPAYVGRYVIDSELGRGGMGVVYKARDPDLGRSVAVKVLRFKKGVGAANTEGRARMLREAQAMAQLSHPNVITVYDVGLEDDTVFIAMELIRGINLKQWLAERRRPWRDVLEMFMQAGRGLEAAHAVGLVHRDFKPANVLIGADGRVRVMDFGIAASRHGSAVWSSAEEFGIDADERLTQTGTVMGTPAYMAPEQATGSGPDAASDQFSYCVALFEALFGETPFDDPGGKVEHRVALRRVKSPPKGGGVPGRVRRAAVRGLSPRPRDRFPSMSDLLRVLERTLLARRYAPVAAIGLIVIAGVAVARASQSDSGCVAGDEQMEDVWGDERRDAVQAAVERTGLPYAKDTLAVVEGRLDSLSSKWTHEYDAACESTRSGPTTTQLDLRLACLREGLAEMRTYVDVLTEADKRVVENAASAVAQLPDPGDCDEPSRLADDAKAPGDPKDAEVVLAVRAKLARAKALGNAGRYEEGVEAATDALDAARDLGYQPVIAEALSRLGGLTAETGDAAKAESYTAEAVWTAMSARHDRVAARAATSLVLLVGVRQARYAEGHEWARHAEVSIARLEESEEIEASLYVNLGLLLDEEGRFEEARTYHDRALAIQRRVLGPRHLEVAETMNNIGILALSQGRFEEAQEQLERALAIKIENVGSDHPDVAVTLNNLGIVATRRGDWANARKYLDRSRQIRVRSLGEDHPLVASTLNNLGIVAAREGDLDKAIELHRRAVELREKTLGPNHPKLASALSNLGTALHSKGEIEAGIAHLERALQIERDALGLNHPEVGNSVFNLGVLLKGQGSGDVAREHFEQALSSWEQALGEDHPRVAIALMALAQSDVDRGDWNAARERLQRSVDIRSSKLRASHPLVAEARLSLSTAERKLGRPERAVEQLSELLGNFKPSDGAEARVEAMARWGLARAIVASGGDTSEARRLATQARGQLSELGDLEEAGKVGAWLGSH